MRRTLNRRGRWFCTPPASSSEPKTKRIFIFLFFLGEGGGGEGGDRVVTDRLHGDVVRAVSLDLTHPVEEP